jgi:hypothetical protein
MGERAYIIKENEDGSFTAVYGHWRTADIRKLAEKGIDKQELRKKLEEWFEEDLENEKKKEYGLVFNLSYSELKEFVNFKHISIETWVILKLNGDIDIYITLVRNFVNGAVRVTNFDNPYKLAWAYKYANGLEMIIDFMVVMGYDKKQAVDDFKFATMQIQKMYHIQEIEVLVCEDLNQRVSGLL